MRTAHTAATAAELQPRPDCTRAAPALQAGHAILLFDGVCLLCNKFVHAVYDNDPAERFQFASLQSEVGLALLEQHGMKADLSTVVLIDEAVAHVAQRRGQRDQAVRERVRPPQVAQHAQRGGRAHVRARLVAKSRYAIWGKDEESCRRLTKAMRRRFIDLAPAA